MTDHVVVTHKGSEYCVFYGKTRTKEEYLFVIDAEDFDKQDADHPWHLLNKYVGYTFPGKNNNRASSSEYLHNVIMDKESGGGKGQRMTVDHISRVKTDNRKANLRVISQTEQNENQKDRERGGNLPEGCGISKKDIPKCVYYVAPQSGHDELFQLELRRNGKRMVLKSSSSVDYSLEDKLIEIKKKILDAAEAYPEFFQDKSIIHNYTEKQIQLMKEYNKIISLSGYKCANKCLIKIPKIKILTVDFSKASFEMRDYLENTNTAIRTGRQHRYNFPKDCDVTQEMMPIGCYCSYTAAKGNRNDFFVIERRSLLPNGKRQWKSDGSKNISTLEKYIQMMDQLVKFGFIKWYDDGTFKVLIKSGITSKSMVGSKTAKKNKRATRKKNSSKNSSKTTTKNVSKSAN